MDIGWRQWAICDICCQPEYEKSLAKDGVTVVLPGFHLAEDTGVEPESGCDSALENAVLASLRQILGPHWDHLKPCDDKRLGFVIARWQALPEHVRQSIFTLAGV